jgi:electron transport complex protein RnfC
MSTVVTPIPGGIRPPLHKTQSNAGPIRQAGIPERLIFPLTQRQADAIPLVTIGQRVLKGELIARAGDAQGAPIHASTSGEIIAIEEHPVADRLRPHALCIVLRTDGHDEAIAHAPRSDAAHCTPSELIERIRTAGVIGAGGAGFPATRKLCDEHGAVLRIDTLIINGAECEPYITADDCLMCERAGDVAQGIDILRRILHPASTLLGVEDDKREALAAMRAACANDIEVVALPTLYPMGGEGQLIQALTGCEVPATGTPADIGVLCFNVGTAYAIFRAIHCGEPMISRIVTITGGACATPANYEVLIGTPLPFLLEKSGLDAGLCATLIVGGPLTGFPIEPAAVPVTRTTHCVIAGTRDEFPPQPTALPCIRCGFCAEACPVRLQPQLLLVAARNDDHARLDTLHLDACIECSACDFVCPSHIPLTQEFREAKRAAQVAVFENAQASQARARFASHQQRITREHAEREQRRAQRLHKPSVNATETSQELVQDKKKAAIQAAIARAKAKKSGAQRPAVAAALEQNESPVVRLRQRILEIELLMQGAEGEYRTRLQRSLDDLHAHLADAEAHPDAPSVRIQIEIALRAARESDPENPA